MHKIILATALTLMCGSAFAQSTGAPATAQSDMNKPMNNNMDKGSMDKGSMNSTTGMNKDRMAKDGMKKDMSKDGSPSAMKKDGMSK